MNKLNTILFIDFDSTFAQVETIDEIAKISLQNDPDQKTKIQLINKITNSAMSGEISFSQALQDRLNILNLNSKHIELVINEVSNNISKSIKRNKKTIQLISNNIWIISGGFTQVICPIVKEYGIKPERVIANTFLLDSNRVKGIDLNNPMSMDQGKIKAINNLNINLKSVMIGDGYTDYEVYHNQASDYFIYYSENILRKEVASKSQFIANSFEEVLDIISKFKS